MPELIDGRCLGEAILAAVSLLGVSILAGIALCRSFDRRSFGHRLAWRGRVVTLRGLPSAEVEGQLKV